MIYFFSNIIDLRPWWSVAMQFAPGSAGVILSSGIVVKNKMSSFYLYNHLVPKIDSEILLCRMILFSIFFIFMNLDI